MKASLMMIGTVVAVVTLSGCAQRYKKTEAQTAAMPVNCATADTDMKTLQAEKTSTAQKIGAGVSMVFPIGLVVGLATGTQGTKYRVTTGQYNEMLDKKIAQIHAACPGVAMIDQSHLDVPYGTGI